MSFSDPFIEQDEPGSAGNGQPDSAEVLPGGSPAGRPDAGGVEVVVRLLGGDTALVGRFEHLEEAKAAAGALVHALAAGEAEGDWPCVAGRFLRPAAVISIDVIEAGPPRWAGSSDRTAVWGGRRE